MSSSERPRGIAATVGEVSSKRPPPPKGKGVAMVVIGVGVVIAIVLTFVLPHDLSERWRNEARQEGRVASPGGSAVPAADFPVPEGLTEPVRARLQEAMNGVTGRNEDARKGLRELPAIIRDAGPEDRAILLPYVAETLPAIADSPTVGPAALDAAIQLTAQGVPGLGAAIAVARTRGLSRPETAPAALALLDIAGDAVHQESAIAVLDLVRDGNQPLHVRVLGARMLQRWGTLEDRIPKDLLDVLR